MTHTGSMLRALYQLLINERLRLRLNIRSTLRTVQLYITAVLYINATGSTVKWMENVEYEEYEDGCTPCRRSRRTCGWRQCAGRRDRAASCAHADSTSSRTELDTEPERSQLWWATRTRTRIDSAGRGRAAAPRTAWDESVSSPVYRTGPLEHRAS